MWHLFVQHVPVVEFSVTFTHKVLKYMGFTLPRLATEQAWLWPLLLWWLFRKCKWREWPIVLRTVPEVCGSFLKQHFTDLIENKMPNISGRNTHTYILLHRVYLNLNLKSKELLHCFIIWKVGLFFLWDRHCICCSIWSVHITAFGKTHKLKV